MCALDRAMDETRATATWSVDNLEMLLHGLKYASTATPIHFPSISSEHRSRHSTSSRVAANSHLLIIVVLVMGRCWDLQILEASYRRSLCRHGGRALRTAAQQQKRGKEGPAHRQRKGGHTSVGTRLRARRGGRPRGGRKGRRPCARQAGGSGSGPVRFGRGARGPAVERAAETNGFWVQRGSSASSRAPTQINSMGALRSVWVRVGYGNRGRRHDSDRTRDKHDDGVQGLAKVLEGSGKEAGRVRYGHSANKDKGGPWGGRRGSAWTRRRRGPPAHSAARAGPNKEEVAKWSGKETARGERTSMERRRARIDGATTCALDASSRGRQR